MAESVDQNPGGPLSTDPVAPQPVFSVPAPAAAAPLVETAPVVEVKSEAPVIVPTEPVKLEPKSELTTERPSLLESATKEPETKPAEVKPADAKPGETKPAEVTAVEVKPVESVKPEAPAVEYKFDYPETVKGDSPRIEEFTTLLRESNVAPEVGQKLLNMAGDAFAEFAQAQSAAQHRAFNSMRDQWNVDWKADPVIGGAGYDTAIKAIARMRDLLVPDDMQKPTVAIGQDDNGNAIKISEFEQFLRVTGAGDHPVFARILHNAARYADEPQHDSLPQNPRPAPNNGRAPGARREILYDHPSSQRRT